MVVSHIPLGLYPEKQQGLVFTQEINSQGGCSLAGRSWLPAAVKLTELQLACQCHQRSLKDKLQQEVTK